MILACSERERDGPRNRCAYARGAGRESPKDLAKLLSGHATVRRPSAIVAYAEVTVPTEPDELLPRTVWLLLVLPPPRFPATAADEAFEREKVGGSPADVGFALSQRLRNGDTSRSAAMRTPTTTPRLLLTPPSLRPSGLSSSWARWRSLSPPRPSAIRAD